MVWQALLALCFGAPLLLIPLARPASADNLWQRVATYSGGLAMRQVITAHIADESVLYAISQAGGIDLSFDGGERWFDGNAGLPRESLGKINILGLATDPQNANVSYLIVGSPPNLPRPMVYWTVDGGLNWQPRASLGRERVQAIAFGPTSADLYVVTPNDVLRAFTFGEEEGTQAQMLTPEERFVQGTDDLHWLSIYAFPSPMRATLARTVQYPADRLPIVAADAVTSTEADADEQATPVEEEGKAPVTLLYIGTDGKGLEIIVDRGTAGQVAVPANSDEDTRYVRQQATIYALCAHPDDPSQLAVATDRGIYHTQDGGATWKSLGAALREQQVRALVMDPTNAQAFYAGLATGGVWRSLDGGRTWELVGHGLEQIPVTALAIGDGGVLYAGTSKGLWRLPLSGAPAS